MAYTTIDDPSAHFQIALYTGNQTARSITNDGNSDLQPDWVWDKNRDSAGYHHNAYDSSRGVGKQLRPNTIEAEISQAQGVTAFNSDGFSLGTDDSSNETSSEYVAWQWKANGGSRTTNAEDGNNPAGGYQANTTAGFSIVDYVGTGAAGTMAHGLGAVPSLIIIKNRDETDSWGVYHSANTSAPETDYLVFNEVDATADDATYWNDTAPTSSVFTVATAHNVNADAENYIAYCFTPIQGYSKFGSYTGNGNADGAFIYTGFKPAFVIAKKTNSTAGWLMLDNKREPSNAIAKFVEVCESGAEASSSDRVDFLSNGFKCRGTVQPNVSNGTYIYLAFAESPFVTSGGVPCTAR